MFKDPKRLFKECWFIEIVLLISVREKMKTLNIAFSKFRTLYIEKYFTELETNKFRQITDNQAHRFSSIFRFDHRAVQTNTLCRFLFCS